MNTLKKILYASMVVACSTTLSAQAQTSLPAGALSMIVTPHNQNVDYLERTLCLNIKANVAYDITSDQDWATVRKGNDGSVYVHVTANYYPQDRSANISFINSDLGIKQYLVLTQDADGSGAYAAELKSADRVYPSSASDNTHASSGNDGGIAYTYDDNTSTLYHSAYSPTKFNVSDSNPVLLTYNFKNVECIKSMTYVPRQDVSNGRFLAFSVWAKYNGSNDYVKIGDYTGTGTTSSIVVTFPDGGLVNPTSIQVRVTSGEGGYATCAEMEFTKPSTATASDLDIFADDLYTTLRPGITEKSIDSITNPFVKSLATKILAGNYSTDYRVAEFPCLLNVNTLANSWNVEGKLYDQMAGVTGISFSPGTYAIVCRNMPEGKTATLKIVSWYQGKTGGNFDGGNPQTMTFSLKNGINTIVYQPTSAGLSYVTPWTHDYDGLGYIVYDDATDPSTVPALKVHFINGIVNGYLSQDKTNEEMYALTANAPNKHMDVVSKKVHAVWTSKGLHDYCKSTDGKIGFRQYMNVLDSLIVWEHDVLGFTKYNRVPENRTFAYVNYTYYMFQGGLGVSFHVDQESRVLNCNTLINKDDDAIWGLSHEWGHQHQLHPYFCWTGTSEVTNNMNSYYNIMRMGYRTSDKINQWAPARKHFIDDNASGRDASSSKRSLAYKNGVSNFSWCADYQNLCKEMVDSVIPTQAENLVKGLSIHEVGVGETLCPFIMLSVYMSRDMNLPDFTPDMYEALRQTDKDGGSTVEKQDGADKYELVASAQNGNKNNGVARLKAAYPNSVWCKYITTDHCARANNTAPFILNYIRKVSRLSGYNLFPYFERWGFLRQIAMYIGDYGNAYYLLPKAAYDEFKADMDALVADGTLKECSDEMVEAISNAADDFRTRPTFPN